MAIPEAGISCLLVTGAGEAESTHRETFKVSSKVASWNDLMPINVSIEILLVSDRSSAGKAISSDKSVFLIDEQSWAISDTEAGLCRKFALTCLIFLFMCHATASAGPEPWYEAKKCCSSEEAGFFFLSAANIWAI